MNSIGSALGFGGSPASSDGSSRSGGPAVQKEEIITSIKHQLAVENATQLINQINENCFERCVGTPGSSLSSSEQTCLSRCMNMYMQSWNVVSRVYVTRLRKESAASGLGGNELGESF